MSIYFTIDGYTCHCPQTPCQNRLIERWRYLNGVLNGQFKQVVGHGGEGNVLEGVWCGVKVAYKFVKVHRKSITWNEAMNDLRSRLNESIQYNETQSDLVVPFYAHYRFKNESHFNN